MLEMHSNFLYRYILGIKLIFLILVLCITQILVAQTNPHFTSLNQKNGLISGDVMCFKQDYNGFMWIGTKYGLNIYDGNNFNVYHLNSGDKPFNSDISSLQKDSINIWIGTLGDGLYLFLKPDHQIIHVPITYNGDTLLNINSIQYWDNSIWIGTESGLFKIDKELNSSYINLNNGIENITELTVHNNQLAVGTNNNGLLLINRNGEQIHYDFINYQISALQSFNNQNLIIGTKTAGLFCLNTNDSIINQECFNIPFISNTVIVNEILVDRQQNIWVGTDGDGLFKLKQEQGKIKIQNHFVYDGKSRNSIASNAIFSLYEDNSGNIWIGTIWKGLSVLNLNTSNAGFYYSDYYGDEQYPVLSIYKNNQELWFGTDGKGLNIFDLESKTVNKYNSDTEPPLNGDYVQTIFKDSQGTIWLGTFSSGLSSFNKEQGSGSIYKNEKGNTGSLSYNDVRVILEDTNTDLWIATWGGGLNKFNRKTKKFNTYHYIEKGVQTHYGDNITSICFSDNKAGLWIGTFGNGLFYFDFNKQEYTRLSLPEFQNLKILNIFLDKQERLWIGTWGNGLKVFDTRNSAEINYPILNRISNSRVTSIEEDFHGRIWFSSKNGIYKLIPSENTLLKFGGFDLITNKEFHINASYIDEEGKIYFGGIEGIITIIPTAELSTESIDPPVITNLRFYNEKLTADLSEKSLKNNRLKLTHNQNYFTFTFSSPHFPVSDVSYSYMMDNFHSDWQLASEDQATFTKIPPGNYVFNVRASVNNFQWSEPAKLVIQITQPIWKRWYAYMIYVSGFVLLLFFFQKYAREWEALKANLKFESLTREKENELHKIKNRFFTNISHEIRTPVTLILGATNRLTENGAVNKENQKEVDVMRTSSRHLLNLINELLDFRRLEMDGIQLRVAEGNFIKFAREIYLSFQTQATSNNIDYKFQSSTEKLILSYDREQMEKVIYNLISNAFKYTPPGGSILIEADNDDQHGYLKVIDSGEGIEETKLAEIFKRFYQSENAADIRKSGFGLGLSIAKDIVQLHGGEIDAMNNAKKGICISVKIPLGSSHFSAEQRLKNFKDSEDINHYITSAKLAPPAISLSEYSDSTLLIVEDNQQLREYIKGLFSDISIVLDASNGEEAWEITLKSFPDLIISDVMMPVMDGVTLTKKLKTDIQTSHIPVILLTARTHLIFKKEGFEIGADEYITKPFNETLLKTRVYNLLKSRNNLRNKVLNEYITNPEVELSISTPDQKFLADLTNVIERNIHENTLSAKLISQELYMSHSVVYKKIKALTGLSMIEFIRDFKLKRATILLVKYRLSVSDVCFKVGFSDRRYFSKIFKIKYGVTPSEYSKSENNSKNGYEIN